MNSRKSVCLFAALQAWHAAQWPQPGFCSTRAWPLEHSICVRQRLISEHAYFPPIQIIIATNNQSCRSPKVNKKLTETDSAQNYESKIAIPMLLDHDHL
ncbi:hypothetical protein CIPAW_01G202500 [Carya illinoinensis]|uniref:Secreted protein n=1 Tax=Carya illinoinensis TaxID=32201 RepID=A0A8T1RQC6_CARIL|nr:hypothetical protein CIPAW_01G202500 [Carya illinoinensis]